MFRAGARSVSAFTPYVSEQLKAYVYLLIDPRDGEVFYVGKGNGSRVFAHAQDALGDEEAASNKLDRIREIHGAGQQVEHQLLRFGLTDRTAFEVEAATIQLLGMDELTNKVEGHHVWRRGRMTTDVAISLFDAPQAPEIKERVILFRIPRLWSPEMSAEELYETTQGWWTLGPRRNGADYAFAVNRGVIREVYRIDSWRQRQPGDRDWEHDIGKSRKRWGFSGEVADELAHYRNTSMRHLFKQGESSPFKYVNC